jgi:multiple sugar transport system substrate-binding protein
MSNKKLSRRDFMRMSALTGAGAALASCAPKAEEPQPEAPAEEEVVEEPPMEEGKPIIFWAGWGGEAFDTAMAAIQETDELKQAIGKDTLDVKSGVPVENFLTALAAGTPPDGASNVIYLDYMARDVVLPVDSFAEASSLMQKDRFIEGSWNQAFYKGRMLGTPAFESFLRYGLNYNIRMFEAAGVDTENLPETWDEWLEVHKVLTKFDDAGNLLQIGLDPTDAMGEGMWDSDGWVVEVSYGLKWFDEDAGTFNLDSEELIASLDDMKKFVDVIGVDNLSGMRSVEGHGTWGGSFNAEVQAMIIEGYWHPGETAAEKPEVAPYNRATWLPVPENRRGVKPQGTGGHLVLMFKESVNPEGMFKVSEVLSTQTAVQIIYDSLGWIGPIKGFSPDISKYPGLQFYFDTIDDANEWHSPAKCPITGFVNDNYVEVREYVLRSDMTSAEAAAELQRRVDDEWIASGLGS